MHSLFLFLTMICALTLPAVAKPVLMVNNYSAEVTCDRRKEGLILEVRSNGLRIDVLSLEPMQWRTIYRHEDRGAFINYPESGLVRVTHPFNPSPFTLFSPNYDDALVDLGNGRQHPLVPSPFQAPDFEGRDHGTWLITEPPGPAVQVRFVGQGRLEVSIYQKLRGQFLNQFQVATSYGKDTSPYSYSFLDQGLFFVLHADGLIRRYEVMTGKELEPMSQLRPQLQRFEFLNFGISDSSSQLHDAKAFETYRQVDRMLVGHKDGILALKSLPYPAQAEDVWRLFNLVLDLRSGHTLMQENGELWLHEPGHLEVLEWRGDERLSFRLPRERFKDYFSYLKAYSALRFHALPKGLIIENDMGHYAGFGDYQSSAHFSEKGQNVTWEQMEACCHRPEELRQQLAAIEP